MDGTVLHDSGQLDEQLDGRLGEGLGLRVTSIAVAADLGCPIQPTAVPIHGLVAIANGPDYCLCGHTWPCEPSTT
jgi:hypothetical protein